jgi:hypothetical protein
LPEPPDVESYLLDWFWELSAVRSAGFSGPNAISYSEISSWIALTGNGVSPDDVAALRAMDAAYLNAVAKEQAEAEERMKGKK